jgi:4-amino-4-deoxy-L-arabinose transferase-like glycosyltransferase
MTTTMTAPAAPEASSERPSGPLRNVGGWLWMPLVFLATVGVRAFGNVRGYDVFVDEVTYLRVSESVAQDLSVRLYGEPFFLHPPAMFFLEGGWLKLLGPFPDVIDGVVAARWLVFLMAGVTAVLAVRLAHVLAGRWAAFATFVLVLLDPFLVRINSRNLLETPTLLFVLAGLLVLAGPLARDQRLTLRRAAAGGALLGLGVLTKDTAALAVSLPLLYLLVRRQTRVAALVAGATLVLTYLPYPLVSALVGQWHTLVDEKSVGAMRLSGNVQLTGFNAPGAASFSDKIVERLSFYGASYALMAAGGLAALYLVLRGGPAHRLLGWWSGASYLLAGYSIVRGTLEEQLFYFVLLPAAVVVPVALATIAARRSPRRRPRPAPVWGLLLLTAWTAPAVLSYVDVHTQRDDAYAQMVSYVDHDLESRTAPRIGVTSDPASVLLRGTEIFRVSTPASVRRQQVDYILVSTSAVANGTSSVTPALQRLIDRSTIVHEVDGRSVGSLELVRVPR